MGLVKRTRQQSKRNKNNRSIVHKIRSIISISRANRRMTRSMSKQLNFISFSSIPLKKTSNAHQMRSSSSTNNKNFKFVDTTLEQGDIVVPEPTNSFVVLYETAMKPSEFQMSASNDAILHGEVAGDSVSGEAAAAATLAAITESTELDDDQIINEILDLMESHGVIESEERLKSVEEIKGDLMSSTSELREHMMELLQLCKYDKLGENST